MKNRFKFSLLTLVLGSLLALSGCGKDDDNSNNTIIGQNNCQAPYVWNGYSCVLNGTGTGTGYPGGNYCQPGTVQTQYGCLPQGNCPYGQALYNNTCIPAMNTGGYPYPGQNNCGYVQTYQYGMLPRCGTVYVGGYPVPVQCPGNSGFILVGISSYRCVM